MDAAVEGREKPVAKPKTKDAHKAKKKKGHSKKGEPVSPPNPKRIELQPTRSLADNLKELPNQCDVGAKRHTTHWTGYKLHPGVVDGDIPAVAILTVEKKLTSPETCAIVASVGLIVTGFCKRLLCYIHISWAHCDGVLQEAHNNWTFSSGDCLMFNHVDRIFA